MEMEMDRRVIYHSIRSIVTWTVVFDVNQWRFSTVMMVFANNLSLSLPLSPERERDDSTQFIRPTDFLIPSPLLRKGKEE